MHLIYAAKCEYVIQPGQAEPLLFMESNEMTAPAVGGMAVTTKAVFSISDEELKAFYLKKVVVLFSNRCSPNPFGVRVTLLVAS